MLRKHLWLNVFRPTRFYLAILCALALSSCASADIPDVRIGTETDALERSKTRGAGEVLKPHIVEIKQEIKADPRSYTDTEIPPECLVVLREFIAYLSANSPNIFYNREAQRKWFATNMQRASAKYLADYLSESQSREFPTFPDNARLIDSWESPSSFSITGYRWLKGNVEIDVLYRWSEDQNYAGDSRLATYDFVKEWVDQREVWRIHAISFEASAKGFSRKNEITVNLWSDTFE